MKKKVDKLEQILKLSEDILSNLETDDISFEKVLAKCKKLARMRNDFEAIKWFALELHGYNKKDIRDGISENDLFGCARRSGRVTMVMNTVTKKEEPRYWIESVSALEVEIQTNTTALENLKPPTQFTPAISKSSYESMYTGATSQQYVVETYQDVLNALLIQKNRLLDAIKHNRELLGKIKNSVYNYVLNVNLQLKFEGITESLFQKTKEVVDTRLAVICPEVIKKLLAAYNRLSSKNTEEWAQALSSCRNALKEFADHIYPPTSQSVTLSNGKVLALTDDKYKNRLLAFIDKESQGNKRRLLFSRAADLSGRIHCLNDMLSQGTHEGLELTDVNICVIDTYLLIGSLLSVVPLSKNQG